MLFVKGLEPEKYKGCTKLWMSLLDFGVDLIEGLHVHFLIVLFDEISILVVLIQLAKKRSELYAVVSVGNIL